MNTVSTFKAVSHRWSVLWNYTQHIVLLFNLNFQNWKCECMDVYSTIISTISIIIDIFIIVCTIIIIIIIIIIFIITIIIIFIIIIITVIIIIIIIIIIFFFSFEIYVLYTFGLDFLFSLPQFIWRLKALLLLLLKM
jgi:hypothetical protein